jgi:hypothetical protein
MKRGSKLYYRIFISALACLIGTSAYAETSQKSIDLARKLYFRLTGSASTPKIREEMASYIEAGDYEKAAHLATQGPGFINNTIRQFSSAIHNRNQNPRANNYSESMLYFMLVAREDRPFDEVLKGKDFPQINIPAGANCPSGNRLACAEEGKYDLSNKDILVSSTNNRVVGSNVPANEAAGIFTMQGFGNAAYDMGTNRRAIQQTFNQLWCLANENMKSDVAVLDYIGRDVPRSSDGDQGSSGVFEKECRKCHSVMDGLKGAFAYMDANGSASISYSANTVNPKYARGREAYPDGFETRDDSWVVTFDRDPGMIAKLGWPSSVVGGKGVSTFGAAVAQTDRFYTCMVEKVIDTVCPQDPNARDTGKNFILHPTKVVPQIASDFKKSKNIRSVFEKVAARPECLGR